MRLYPSAVFFTCFFKGVAAGSGASTTLWYSSPATDFNAALPIGNGRLGAMIYGKTGNETISLNEDSIWSGGFTNRVNTKAVAAAPDVTEYMLDGNITKANSAWVSGMATSLRESIYQPMCSLALAFGHDGATSYNRSLDLHAGVATVSYMLDGTKYTREAIASFPHGILAFHFSASTPSSINFNISLTRTQNVTSVSVKSNDSVVLSGTGSTDDTISFISEARVMTEGGTVTANGEDSLIVKNADVVYIYVDGETSWRYPSEVTREAVLQRKLNRAVSLGWNKISGKAMQDYGGLAHRTSLDLGDSGTAGALATDQRLDNWRAGANFTTDPELITLMFNYGRYLLISSSRNGSLPANLQGIWNEDFAPEWDSKFTLNINLEMNYWASETTNLPETTLPLFEHISRMQLRGQEVARQMYNMSGWVCHHNTDIWGDCAPLDSQTYYAAWPMSPAWLMLHLFEHYRFGRNAEFATERALPIVEGALEFYYDFLEERAGQYVTPYGVSPENQYYIPPGKANAKGKSGLDVAPAMDRQLLHELLSGYLELKSASKRTGGVAKAQKYLSMIEGPIIGSLGQLLEWSGEFNETEVGHRHLSHLVGLFPGGQIHPLINKTISNASAVSLQRRMDNGSGQTGWSAAWAIALYARLFDGDNALYRAGKLIDNSVFDNLLGKTSIFQIDANLGFPGAIAELLLQSHTSFVHIGPSLPKTLVPNGSVIGLRARGGYVVSMTWKEHRITKASILSTLEGSLSLKVEDERKFLVDGHKYTGPIITKAGRKYSITLS
ncbi:uncharacterized protein N7446_007064 [Penicillium canescens]|uniref:Glycosyl hydrolase family 95 N-terminal domain-containing protein n=1 Tax=Penicillium canescens TaxID=5083 RepID=A0AAD6ND88_PENCN|nr:uncharacterized protein N7446_007064 [Penicillium canescens]KAJ6049611.1 hypothetical protein N7444_006327 [Penicillium canescens]KAJ6052421.1 hypothetical protein N7460_002955 [Penicillium canescens]KAJ6062944.1 hypothetical protein N7446_007064 [Penicillium canescens]